MRILTAADHGGFKLKKVITDLLCSWGYMVTDLGVNAPQAVDYPDIARKACAAFKTGGYDLGILCCGTGIGISIAANKIQGIRCALVHDKFTARMARVHNSANFLALGGRVDFPCSVAEILEAFLTAQYEGGRHQTRIGKIACLEAGL